MTRPALSRSIVVLAASVTLGACQGAPEPPGSAACPFDRPAAEVVARLERFGGIAGSDDVYSVHADGTVDHAHAFRMVPPTSALSTNGAADVTALFDRVASTDVFGVDQGCYDESCPGCPDSAGGSLVLVRDGRPYYWSGGFPAEVGDAYLLVLDLASTVAP